MERGVCSSSKAVFPLFSDLRSLQPRLKAISGAEASATTVQLHHSASSQRHHQKASLSHPTPRGFVRSDSATEPTEDQSCLRDTKHNTLHFTAHNPQLDIHSRQWIDYLAITTTTNSVCGFGSHCGHGAGNMNRWRALAAWPSTPDGTKTHLSRSALLGMS